MVFVRNVKDITKNDVKLAGGKGASLGEMTQAGIPVPPGFVILASAYEKFVTEGKVPEDVVKEIKKAFKKLGAKKVAVRSSATAEDAKDAAWAGQLESYLNTTEKDLLKNVEKCWESLQAPRAKFYRSEKGLNTKKISVAVVVQEMVASEVSGVAFSVHPVTEDKNQMIIEAVSGLGEKLVSGQTTPGRYVIERSSLRLLDMHKEGKQKLSEKQIKELAKLVEKIEKHYRFPVDVEWAYAKGKFYIVQSRPITTLKNLKKKQQGIFEYIQSQRWFFGVRNEESLLFYSAKGDGYTKHLKKEYGTTFAESLLVPLKKDRPIRVFNLWQAKSFHAVSNEKILKNPRILVSYVKKDDAVYRKIEVLGKNLLKAIEKGGYRESVELFQDITALYEIAGAYFIIIFSLGLKLAENKKVLKNVKEIERTHNIWRNSVAFKEEAMGEHLFYFFKFLVANRKLPCNPLLLMKFLTLNEVRRWLSGGTTNKKVLDLVSKRSKNGYIYLNLRDEKQEVIDDVRKINEIQKYFLKLDAESNKSRNNDELSGQVAYSSGKKIIGQVVVIKDKAELKHKSHLIDGKILVAIQTTPHFIPYIKKAKAIITDEGGLTCHAAIVAREMKIPCIVGTKVATQVLRTGDAVEVNAGEGTVHIIKKAQRD